MIPKQQDPPKQDTPKQDPPAKETAPVKQAPKEEAPTGVKMAVQDVLNAEQNRIAAEDKVKTIKAQIAASEAHVAAKKTDLVTAEQLVADAKDHEATQIEEAIAMLQVKLKTIRG